MRIAFFSTTLLASSLVSAATPIDGLYASVFGGYSYLPDHISRFHSGTFYDRASFNNGFNAGLRFGYQSHPMRYEGEFTFINAKASSFRLRQFFIRPFSRREVTGQTSAGFGMANIYYDFPEMVPCIAPYVGVGLGYGLVESTLTSRNLFRQYHFKGSDSAFAYQGTAGLTFNFAENYSLNIAYRYIGTTKINQLGKSLQANLGSVGVVYRFDEYNYK